MCNRANNVLCKVPCSCIYFASTLPSTSLTLGTRTITCSCLINDHEIHIKFLSSSNMVRNVLFFPLQFYLSKNILLVTSLNSGWPLNDTTLLKWSEVESLGIWDNAIQMRSTEEDTYILLKIRLNGTSYDHLHDRALEVCRELFNEEKRPKKSYHVLLE